MIITDIFAELANIPRWVPFKLVWNEQRQKDDKIPHNGHHGLSTKAPDQWMTLLDALTIAKEMALAGVGFVVTGGVEVAGWRLVSFDCDDVDFEHFVFPFKTYAEKSPSGKGIRTFLWVPSAWAIKYQDNTKAHPAHCNHCEIYIGTSPRFLTVTFNAINEFPILELQDEKQLASLATLLKPADLPSDTALPEITEGTPLDLRLYSLASDQRLLINGKLPKGERSPVVHGLSIKLIDSGLPLEDVLATLVQTQPIWKYCLDHRQENTAKALAFANDEVKRAYEASKTYLYAKIGLTFPPVALTPLPLKPGTPLLISGAELVKKAGPISWLIRDYFETDTVALLFGESGHYKTFLAFDITVSVASGLPFHGHAVKQQGPVLYICGEGHNGIARRYQAACQHRGLDPAMLPVSFSTAAIGLTDADNTNRLKEAIGTLDQPPVLLIVDTLARNFGDGDENSTRDMNAFIASIDALRGEATVLIVHHSGNTNLDRERGNSALRGGIDARYRVEYDSKLHVVQVTSLKMKDAELAATLYLTPNTVELPFQDDTGHYATSVVLMDGEDQKAARVAEFYKHYPKLGTGQRKEYLPKMLELMFDTPGISQQELHRQTGRAQATIKDLLEVLREYQMIEPNSVLTPAGLQAAYILCTGDITIRIFQQQGNRVGTLF